VADLASRSQGFCAKAFLRKLRKQVAARRTFSRALANWPQAATREAAGRSLPSCRLLRTYRRTRLSRQTAHVEASVRFGLPAQPVDATPSNALIRQCFPRRSDLFGCTRSKPSQGSVPADLTLASDLSFVFNASRVRPECCIDPLRPPPKLETWVMGLLFRPGANWTRMLMRTATDQVTRT
jgi:hypothetical protein